MRIVVTGALGHIGSRLIRDLPQAFPTAEMTLIDNLSSQRYFSLFHLPQTGHYRFHEANLLDAKIAPLIQGAEALIHLAALTDATQSVQQREQVRLHNLTATRRVAESCAQLGVPILFVSTTSVYGTRKKTIDETCDPKDLIPHSPYAETKLKEEAVLRELAETKGLRYTICRFSTIFGVSPGMRFHTAVNKFCWQASLGLPLTVWRTAMNQLRPYLDLSDGIRALLFLLEKNQFQNHVYNVLTFNATVSQIIDAIREFVPDLEVNYVDEKVMNDFSYTVSNARFQSLGFRFEGDLRNSVKETLELLKAARSSPPDFKRSA